MIATHNQQASEDNSSSNLTTKSTPESQQKKASTINKIKNLPSQLLRSNRIMTHHPKAGLNPLVDAASHLFSLLGKLKQSPSLLSKLQKELIREVTRFQETVKNQGYDADYAIVCQYVLCATFDDIITNITEGDQENSHYSLLSTFNQDTQHQDKFFAIIHRAMKEPDHYIDLMELMYICLCMGYKGRYRSITHAYQLEQVTNQLYQHIRAHRGHISKTLSPHQKTAKSPGKKSPQNNFSTLFIFFVTTCIIMIVFASLGYLMDVISNEAYTYLSPIENAVSHETSRQ